MKEFKYLVETSGSLPSRMNLSYQDWLSSARRKTPSPLPPSTRERSGIISTHDIYVIPQEDESITRGRSSSLPIIITTGLQEYRTAGTSTLRTTEVTKLDGVAKSSPSSTSLADITKQNLLARLSLLQQKMHASLSESTKQKITDSHGELTNLNESELSPKRLSDFAEKIGNLETEVINNLELVSRQENLQQKIIRLKNELVLQAVNTEMLDRMSRELQELETSGVPVFSLSILVKVKSQLRQLRVLAGNNTKYLEKLLRAETLLEAPCSIQAVKANEFIVLELENRIHIRDSSTSSEFLMNVIHTQLESIRKSATQASSQKTELESPEDVTSSASHQVTLLQKQQSIARKILNQASTHQRKDALTQKVKAFEGQKLSSAHLSQFEIIQQRLQLLTSSEEKQVEQLKELAEINNLLDDSLTPVQAKSINSQLNTIDKHASALDLQFQRQLEEIESNLSELEQRLKLSKLGSSLKQLDEEMKPLAESDQLRKELMLINSQFVTHSVQLTKDHIDQLVTDLNQKLVSLQSKLTIALASQAKAESAVVKIPPPVAPKPKGVKIPSSTEFSTLVDLPKALQPEVKLSIKTEIESKSKKKPAFAVPTVAKTFTRVTKRLLDEAVTDTEKPSTSKVLAFPRVLRGAVEPSASKDITASEASSSESDSSTVSSARCSVQSSAPVTDKAVLSTEKLLEQVSEKLKESSEQKRKTYSIKMTKGTSLIREQYKMAKFKTGSGIRFTETAVISKTKASVVDSTRKSEDELDVSEVVRKAKEALAQAEQIISDDEED